jgi:hypothetical protein
MASGLLTIEYREGNLPPVEYMTQDRDAIKSAFRNHLASGTPEFVEVERRDARSMRTVIIRLSSVRAIAFAITRD